MALPTIAEDHHVANSHPAHSSCGQFEAPLPSTISRREMLQRGRCVMESEIAYIYHSSFDEDVAEEYLADYQPAAGEVTQPLKRAGAGLPAYLASLYEIPLLSPGREAHLFRKMNYLKHRAEQLRRSLDLRTVTAEELDEICECLRNAKAVRDELIRSNLRLVVSIAKQFVDGCNSFDDLVSEGNMALLRAVEKFDYARGNRFSTYATWAIKRNLFHALNGERRQHTRFIRGDQEILETSESAPRRNAPVPALDTLNTLSTLVGQLSPREQEVLSLRFGLQDADRRHSLREIGGYLGVSKERIRQIEIRALHRLRKLATAARLESPQEA